MTFAIRMLAGALVLVAVVRAGSQLSARPQVFGGRTLLHAHNAYPDEGRYRDRLARALATGIAPLVIEQDVANRAGAAVVSHDTDLDGTEPSLEQHFFARVAPDIEAALKTGDTTRWPQLVLHLDFKTNERAHHRAVWDLLIKYRSWLTTAPVDEHRVTPFTLGPLLVLTENGTDQEKDFSEWAAAGGRHLLFGSIPPAAIEPTTDEGARARRLVRAAPAALMPSAATSYRRWVNFPWAVVEEGGPPRAGDWTPDDESRLLSVVRYAHERGLLIRFYTLNGHREAATRGWTAGYNFGSLEAARLRWQAAVRSQVDLLATDQYEEFGLVLKARQ